MVDLDVQGVGVQGLVYAEGAYIERFGDLIAKKTRLGVDSWGATEYEIPEVFEPVHELIARELPDWDPYPWTPARPAVRAGRRPAGQSSRMTVSR